MQTFFAFLFTTSVAMSAVILLLFFLRRVLNNRVSAAFRYYIWVVALIGLLVPFRLNIPTPFTPVELPLLDTSSVTSPVQGAAPTQAGQAPTVKEPVPEVEGSGSFFEGISIPQVLFGIWIVGTLVVLLRHLYSYRKFNLAVARWGTEVTDPRVISAFQWAKEDLGLSDKNIPLVTCEFVSTPLLAGIWKPRILLPKREIDTEDLLDIFRHELTHYKHKDLWMNLIVLAASAVHWFNPLVYIMAKTIRVDRETACDEAVVANKDTENRKNYGEIIISFVGVRPTITPALSTSFYTKKNNMKKRLVTIMDTQKKRKSIAVTSGAVVCAAALLTGAVFVVPAISDNSNGLISDNTAKSIALEHAGVSENEVTIKKVELDTDNGLTTYDVEFYKNNAEYDYEIDANSGDIISYDHGVKNSKAKGTSTPAPSSAKSIDEATAKSIALKHAGVKESDTVYLRTRLDRDDNIPVYDVEFSTNDTEYDYEISVEDGSIISSERDTNHKQNSKNTSATPQESATPKEPATPTQPAAPTKTATPTQPAAPTKAATPTQPATPKAPASNRISEAKAKSIALSAAGLSESQITEYEIELDMEHNTLVYEISFDQGRTEYDYEIDAITGKILKSEVDHDD